jgi:hypothetical protein
MLTLVLHCPGNPDFGQTGKAAPSLRCSGASAAELVDVALQYRDRHELGGGNFIAWLERDGRKVAELSYNGRLWTPSSEPRRELTEEQVDAA